MASSAERKSIIAISSRVGFVALLAVASISAPSVPAQQPKIWRVAFLSYANPETASGALEAFRRGLGDLGYVEGRNLTIDQFWADGKRDRLPQLTAELIQRNPDLILGSSTEVIAAARQATSNVPIVMAAGSDPVKTGLVASLARPGGNITGLSNMAGETSGKLIEIARELLPKASRATVLLSSDRTSAAKWSDAQTAGKSLNFAMELITVTNREEIENAFALLARNKRGGVLIVPADAFLQTNRTLVIQLAARNKIPAVYARDMYVRDGGLVSYGLSIKQMFYRSASYVDRIFKGAKPGDLPIEQASKFELILNRTAAKGLGLALPRDFMLRVDEVID